MFSRTARLCLLLLTLTCPLARAQEAAAPAARQDPATAAWDEQFRTPPDTVKPWAYWWWLKGNVDEALIVRDLEGIREKGFNGVLLFDSRGYHEDHVPPPESRMEFMSPQWRAMVRRAVVEADRLGLKVSVNLSSGAGALKGPWAVGDDAPKKLVYSSLPVAGSQTVRCQLIKPEGSSWEVALLAVRQAAASDPPEEADAVRQTGRAAGEPAELDFPQQWQEVAGGLSDVPPPAEVLDLTDSVDRQGRLVWQAPPGEWTLLRFTSLLMEGHEYDVDILDRAAVEGHFDRLGRALLEDAGPLAAQTLTHFYSVSWEGAAPTWTRDFDRHFQQYRGYRLRDYLPVLAGIRVGSREASERFLRDYYKTLGDCFMEHCYGHLRELCRREGLKWHSESGGPWNRKLAAFRQADQLAFLARNDMPQGEFWHLSRAMNRPAAMSAHIYGLPLAATEAFTHMQPHWTAYPATLKIDADRAFCDGINHFIWHTFTASPPEFGKPGIEYFAGTHINPNVTWWNQAGELLTYLARCQLLLRQGDFVADVCCYTGDSPYLHWGRGERWTDSATRQLGSGFAYDLISTEVLAERMRVEDGWLVLPGGMRYRLLVLDLEDETIPPQALEKIVQLAEAGATIVLGDRQPQRAPGLSGYPACDQQIRQLAKRLWGPADAAGDRTLGRGRVFRGTAVDDALQQLGVPRDFDGPWDYIHRRAGDADIYFVSGSGAAECIFRTAGREPELFCPRTGQRRDAVRFRKLDAQRTAVPLDLPENGSVFVVFRRPADPAHLLSAPGQEAGLEIVGRADGGLQVDLWQAGRFELQASDGSFRTLDSSGLPEPQPLAAPWEVHFADPWGDTQPASGTDGSPAPLRSVRFDRLIPWNAHADEEIKYFSGTATYRQRFDLNGQQVAARVRLELGQVRHVAEVRVNGRPLGVVWTAPWTADLTGAVREGTNELEIDVTNLWVNRLVGDARLPVEQRRTKTNVALGSPAGDRPTFRGYPADSPLEPSGLLGPVQLRFGRRVDVGLEEARPDQSR